MSLKQENLISTSVQYKVGQRLVKVGNSFVPVGFGGNFEPGAGSCDTSEFESEMVEIIGEDASVPPVIVTGGSKFYKCASVAKAQNSNIASQYPTYQISNPNSSTYSGTYTYIGSFLYSNPDTETTQSGYHLWQCNKGYYIMVPPNDVVYLAELLGLDKQNMSFSHFIHLGSNWEVVPTDVVQGIDSFYIDDWNEGWRWTATKVEAPAAQPQDVPKTWSGYQLMFQDGVYKVSDVLTDNLSYTFVTPQVGGYYSADALIKIDNFYSGKIPEEGLVWFASLNKNLSDIATTGVTESGHVMDALPSGWSFTEHENIPCLYLDGHNDGRWTSTDSTNMPMQINERTISFWVKIIRGTSENNGGRNDYPYKYNQCGIIGYGIHNSYSTGNFYDVVIDTVSAQYCTKGRIAIHSYSYGAGDFYAKKETDWFSKWCHVAITNFFSGSSVRSNFYLNGEFVESYSWDEGKTGGCPTSFNRLSIGNKN